MQAAKPEIDGCGPSASGSVVRQVCVDVTHREGLPGGLMVEVLC
jgi:hypothetical protein